MIERSICKCFEKNLEINRLTVARVVTIPLLLRNAEERFYGLGVDVIDEKVEFPARTNV